MTSNKNIHFEVSERKILLRIFDSIIVVAVLFGLNCFTSFDYLTINLDNAFEVFVLVFYLLLFGTIFEIYDLQKASKFETITTNIVITTSTLVLFYVLTPFYTPVLPDNRFQLLFFSLAIFGALLIWRFAYIQFISTPRFYKRVLLVGEMSEIKDVYDSLYSVDPSYVIVGFINCENTSDIASFLIKFQNINHQIL